MPHLWGQQLPFWRFLTSFLPTETSISICSQHLLTKILENVFQALKLPHSKYHFIWTPRSKENQFQRSLFRGRPFEISTFIFHFFFWKNVEIPMYETFKKFSFFNFCRKNHHQNPHRYVFEFFLYTKSISRYYRNYRLFIRYSCYQSKNFTFFFRFFNSFSS